jgi:trehalose synthase
LQRVSSVVIQKSLREGFGLTVSEALLKGTPVVASNVGGIPLQLIDGKNGFLVNNVKECAEKTIKLLKDKKLEKKMGKFGKEHVRRNFLITRHLLDYIKILRYVFRK